MKLACCETCRFWVPLAGSKFGECHEQIREVGTDGRVKWPKTQGDVPGCGKHQPEEQPDVQHGKDAGTGAALPVPDHGVPDADKPSKVAKGKVGKS